MAGIQTLDVNRWHPCGRLKCLDDHSCCKGLETDHPCGRKTAHYWLLVNIEGKWFQFDAGLRAIPFDGFLFTKEAGDEYSKIVKDYYYFDVSLYSDIVIE